MMIKSLQTALRRLIPCIVMLQAGVAGAGSVELFRTGNKAYADGRFEEAANTYMEAAAQAPDSMEIHYNLGNAQYRAGAFDQAVQAYEYAASLAETDMMRSRCWYNLGNCLVKTGESLREEDPYAAVNYCRQAASFYRLAFDYDPAFPDAAYNLEMAQWIAADIEEEVRRKEEEEEKENELIAYIRKKLQEFIERQDVLIQSNITGEPQQQLEAETRELVDVMEQSGLHTEIPLPDGTVVPGPLNETWNHTQRAADAMAVPDQPTALEELIAALGAAPEDPNQQDGESDEDSYDYDEDDMDYEESDEEAEMYEEGNPFGDFSEYEEIRGIPPPNQTEMDILAEEVRNQERRKQKKAGEYKPVDKDW